MPAWLLRFKLETSVRGDVEACIPPGCEQELPHLSTSFASLYERGLVVHIRGGLGEVNKLLEGWQGAVMAKIIVLVLIVLFIQKRPQGIFALKGRSAD